MSDSTTPPIPPSDPSSARLDKLEKQLLSLKPITASSSDLGAIVTASWSQAIMAATLALAVLKILPDGALLILIGAVIANSEKAANYFLGSSKGSKDKDQTIAEQSTQLLYSTPSPLLLPAPHPIIPTLQPPGGTVTTTVHQDPPAPKPAAPPPPTP